MEAVGAVSSVFAVVSAAKGTVDIIIQLKGWLEQVKQNREDHANQIEQILRLLEDTHAACAGITIASVRPGLLEAVNKLKANLEQHLQRCRDLNIPKNFAKALWKREVIKKTLEDVEAGVSEFLRQFTMLSNIRIERQISENSDKLDRLLSLERSSPHMPSSGSTKTVSSRRTKEYLIGQLQKLSESLSTKRPSPRVFSPSHPDQLVSNTHRPHVSESETTKTLLGAIGKTKNIIETYDTNSAGASAHSLDMLSVSLMDVGLATQASEISSFSVRIYGSIPAPEPDPNFAIALHNHAYHLSASGRAHEAVEQAWRAVDIYRQLHGSVFRPGRAKALDTLAACLYAVGEKKEALAMSDEAVLLSRDLQRRRPTDECLSADLAMLLRNRATRLLALGCNAEALQDASDSRKAYQKLSQQQNSDRYTPEYAESLRVHSEVLFHLGRASEALDPARKAVSRWRELEKINPDVYTPKLARGLFTVSVILRTLPRRIEALAEIRTAVELYRQLAAQSPEIFNPEYARALHCTAQVLMEQKHHRKALESLQEAASIYASLLPGKWDSQFATVYDDQHICLNALNRRAEAAAALRTAVDIVEKAPPFVNQESQYMTLRCNLASVLYNLSIEQECMPDVAIGPASQAVELFHILLEETPNDEIIRRRFVEATRFLSLFHTDLQNHGEALEFAKHSVREGIKLEDRLIVKNAWKRLSNCRHNMGDEKNAVYAQNQANKL